MEPELLVILGLFVYIIPSLMARKKQNAKGIIALNILLGWTYIGWAVAFIWALCDKEKPEDKKEDDGIY